jgi:hypothetical protein
MLGFLPYLEGVFGLEVFNAAGSADSPLDDPLVVDPSTVSGRLFGGRYVTIYGENYQRGRFTRSHEVVHKLMGHEDTQHRTTLGGERDVDFVAAEICMPRRHYFQKWLERFGGFFVADRSSLGIQKLYGYSGLAQEMPKRHELLCRINTFCAVIFPSQN